MELEAKRDSAKLLPWIIYLIFFAVLNETVFNVSTPMVAQQFGLSAAGVGWMMTIFLVFFGIGSVIYGKLSDIFSLRLLIQVGTYIYVAGSILGFAFQFNYPMVILARAIQGMGGSAIPALIFVTVARFFENDQRGKVFGTISAVVSVAIGLGPVIGGFVAGSLHWAWLFLIPLFCLISIPAFRRLLPSEARRPGSVDLVGAALVALVVGGLILALNFNDWYYWLGFGLSLALLLARILLAKDPFIQPSLFRNARFRAGVIVGFSLFSIIMGVMFLVPLMLHAMHGLQPNQIGLVLFPGAISSVVFGPVAGWLADKRGNNFVVAIGLALLALSLVALSAFQSLSPIAVGAALLPLFIGFALFQTAMINSVSQTLPPQETGVGMGLFNLVSIISGAVGTALVGKILDAGWLNHNFLNPAAEAKGMDYSNLLLAFTAVVLVGGLVYSQAFAKARQPKAPETEVSNGCADNLDGLANNPDCA